LLLFVFVSTGCPDLPRPQFRVEGGAGRGAVGHRSSSPAKARGSETA